MKHCLLYCLFFVCCVHGYGQYQVEHFNTENGLPSSGIKGLQWDKTTGFLWIATEAGLVRYNGMTFKTFDNTTNPELGSNRIKMLVKNASGKILAGGEEGNLTVVKNN
jgi:ligand-binding sensor domain-containing protein